MSLIERMRGARGRVLTDDERSQSPGLYVMVGLLSIGLVAAFLAFLVVPPALAAHLFIQGGKSGSVLLRATAGLVFLIWFAGLMLIGTRVMRRPEPPTESGPE